MDPLKKAASNRSDAALRLTRERWVEAAMEVLGTQGVEGVRVEQLAKLLKVTKGSFYWHFKGRDDLLEAMLDHWRRQNAAHIANYAGRLQDPVGRLEALARMPFDVENREPFGLPLRLWARNDARAGEALAQVDELRLRMMAETFQACGFGAEEARARAVLLYAYMRVAPTLPELGDAGLRGLCEQLLLEKRAPTG